MKKIIGSIFIIVVICIGFIIAKDDSFSIDKVHIHAHIATDGTVHVEELYHYAFDDTNNKIIRTMPSTAENLQAFTVPNGMKAPSIDTDNLDPLEVEKIHDAYHINLQHTTDATKRIIYSYTVKEAVTKYEDIADFRYNFFNNSNYARLNNVTVSLSRPQATLPEKSFIYFHSKNQPSTLQTNNILQYSYDSVLPSRSHDFRFLFPATELVDRPTDVDKKMKRKLFASESSLQWRYQNIEENFNKAIPFLVIGILFTIIIGTCLFYFHPNRKKSQLAQQELLTLLEKSDPLIVSYIHKEGKFDDKDLIAGLFSLHDRGLVTMTEVPSELNLGTTFRFTWKRSREKLQESDQYVKDWLFTQEDKYGSYFLLESFVNPDEATTRSAKRKSRKQYKKRLREWFQLVEEQPGFKENRKTYISYYLFTSMLLFFTIGMFIYLLFHSVWPREMQFTWTIIITLLGCLIVWEKYDRLLVGIFFAVIGLLAIFITISIASILFLLLLIVAGGFAFITPSTYWNAENSFLPFAIKHARKEFRKQRYPMGNTPKTIQKQLQIAIIVEQEDGFAHQCLAVPQSLLTNGQYPMLHNPNITAFTFMETGGRFLRFHL
ncbi:DUF2207 domain-containing protein [Aquibacillus koreensis]|uniref:DUF2207 domain-containing protein n=1 Tax=Aquibacillus koreensis TaxID=279446 RepID=A0A9X3WMW2_9BACI|nr:DUF2207 domain-containing protein [Aquibacillus koreensis]MCT2536646.1 DUF2207 domain-containing protein [Aquibacillus koreensis]MDC3422600.1 DUF2207 domain-containing protein [Aquibacillus koreensis]